MPTNFDAPIPIAANPGMARISAANTARDGSGTLVTLLTCGANGTAITSIKFRSAQATAAASASMVWRVYVSDTSGANPRFVEEIPVTGVTASTTAAGASGAVYFPNPWVLKTGQIVYVTQSIYGGPADQTDVIAYAGDY